MVGKSQSKSKTKKSAKKTISTKRTVTVKQKISAWGNFWRFMLCIAVPLVVGGLSAFLTQGNMSKFGEFNQPPLSPPAWLFPVAWTALYALMGIASFLIWRSGVMTKSKKSWANGALFLYGLQLVFNFCWSPIFFNLEWFWFAFGWLVVMWLLIIVLIGNTKKLSCAAFWLLMPYVLWTTFAAYLNCAIALLN